MKLIYMLLITLILSSCTTWWSVSDIPYYAKKVAWRNKSTPINKNYFDSINVEIIDGHMIGKVKVAGVEGLYLFDTGALTIIDAHNVARKGVKTSPKPKYNVRDEEDYYYKHIRKRKMFKSDFVNLIDTVMIGSTTFKKVGTQTINWDILDYNHECNNHAGILGNNVMKDGIWSFNYKDEKILFSNNIKNFNLNSALKYDLNKFINNMPIINMPIGDTIFRVGIDTGNASLSISTNDNLTKSQTISHLNIVIKNVENMNTSSYLSKSFTKKYAQLIQFKTNILGYNYNIKAISNMKIDNNDEHKKLIDLIVGYEFLKNFITTIDYVNNKLYLQPVESNSPNYFDGLRNINFSLLKYDNKPYISNYLPNLIDSTKVDIGDPVLAINNVPIDSILKNDNYCEFIRGEQSFYSEPDINIITIKNKKGEVLDFKTYLVPFFE